MLNYPYVSLVIPCYNEGPRLGLLWQGLCAFSEQWPGDFEVVLVDDGSTDGGLVSLGSMEGYAGLADRIRVIQQVNTGKGGALRTGVMAAKGDFVLTLDADMAAAPTELLHWLDLRKAFYTKEILIGSREMPNSDVLDSRQRQVVGRIFNRLIRLMTGMPYKDTQCGFKLYSREVARVLFEPLKTMGWAHDVEILLRANKMGYAVIQMPLRWRAVEGSKIRVLRDGVVMFNELIRIVLLRI